MYFFADLKIVPPPYFDKTIYINTIIIPSIYQLLAIALKKCISYRPTFLCQCILTVVNFENIGQCLFHHNRSEYYSENVGSNMKTGMHE